MHLTVTRRVVRRYTTMSGAQKSLPPGASVQLTYKEDRMRPSITVGLFVVALGVATTACRDAAPAAPQQALDIRDPSGSDGAPSGDDSSSTSEPTSPTAPVDPAPGPDTAMSPPPALPASFTLNGVAAGVLSGTDTTQTVRVPGVTARLYRVRAADGSAVVETLAGSAIADANGEFVFADVASAYYRIDVTAPDGGPYVDGSVSIPPPWATQIRVHVVLHRKR